MTTPIENAPGTCGMLFARHPDDERRPDRDDPCLRPAIGESAEGVRLCKECADDMESEGFRVDRDAPSSVHAEPITDEQICELRNKALADGDHDLVATCHDALPGSTRWESVADWGESRTVTEQERKAAREVCAAAWNARRGAEP